MNNPNKQTPDFHEKSDHEKLVSVEQSITFSGPLPHPIHLEKYEQILPGLADRITKMTESQSLHRKKLESRVITFDIAKSAMGLVLAFLIVISALVTGAYVILNGQAWAGGILGLFPLSSIVGMFIYQKYRRNESKK